MNRKQQAGGRSPGGGAAGPPKHRKGPGRWLALLLPALGVAGAVTAVGFRERIVRFRAGGEDQVRAALAAVTSLRFEAGAPPLSVELPRVAYRDVSAAVEGGKATAVTMVEADGAVAFDGQAPQLGYLGREVVALAPCAGPGWCAAAPLPRLAEVLEALRRRHRALAQAEPGRRVRAWQIRVERETAEVGEDLETAGPGGGPARSRVRFTLRRSGGAWVEAG
ncbi:MAG: hypothetical protein HZB56_22390 [Deltaproteobacteria bacterium]|nr:hypothetical protein [Deltaproteobacteria bacterium]